MALASALDWVGLLSLPKQDAGIAKGSPTQNSL
jgi:hypothetical protein